MSGNASANEYVVPTDGALTPENIAAFDSALRREHIYQLAQNAITRADPVDVLMRRDVDVDVSHVFSSQISQDVKVTNQEASGRCWIFAALNVLRLRLMRKLALPDSFELSQSFVFFFDKLEKANLYLENIIETRDLATDSREVMFLNTDPVCDGGQWDMFVALVRKHGVVPKAAFPESWSSSHSYRLNFLLSFKLRETACRMREYYASTSSVAGMRQMKDKFMPVVYRMLCIFLGTPPTTFTWSYRDKEKAFHELKDQTPLGFFKTQVVDDLDEYVCLINAPTRDKPFYRTFTVKYLGSVAGGPPVHYLNVPIDVLRSATSKSIDADEAVWFGCDVGKFFMKKKGAMDTNQFDYDLVFGVKLTMNKAARLDYGESKLTHAMAISGYHRGAAGIERWRVENSWGEKEDMGEKGWFLMTDDWFGEYVYEVVVHKRHLAPDVLESAALPPIVLPPWDPMGALARCD